MQTSPTLASPLCMHILKVFSEFAFYAHNSFSLHYLKRVESLRSGYL